MYNKRIMKVLALFLVATLVFETDVTKVCAEEIVSKNSKVEGFVANEQEEKVKTDSLKEEMDEEDDYKEELYDSEMSEEEEFLEEYGLSNVEDVDVTFITEIQFTEEEAAAYKEAMERDLAEHYEMLTNEIMLAQDEATKEYLEKQMDNVTKIDVDAVFANDNVVEVPMRDVSIKLDGDVEVTDESGTIQLEAEEAAKIATEHLDEDIEVKGNNITVKSSISGEEFAEGGLQMADRMENGIAQKITCVTCKKQYEKGHTWGTNRSKTVVCTTKKKNVVYCNKCDVSNKENYNAKDWAVGNSDCAISVRLGMMASSIGGTTLITYSRSVKCVIEACQSAGQKLHEDSKWTNNVYCNGINKNGHFNCSWFTGIQHTEEFHLHKYK